MKQKDNLAKQREKWLKLTILKEWKRITTMLIQEHKQAKEAEDLYVESVSKVSLLLIQKLLCPLVFRSLRANIILNKEERFKANHKAAIWTKINSWLAQYDSLDS